MTKTIVVTVVAKVHLIDEDIVEAMEDDEHGGTRTEDQALYALALRSFSPAWGVDVKELTIHQSK